MTSKTPFSKKEANDSPGFLLWQVTAIWQRRIAAALRPYGLTQVQYALLASLLWLSIHEKLVTQTMIARSAKLDIMMTSQVLRSLERRGFVERKAHPSDTRAKILLLTKKGKELIWKAVPAVEKADDIFFSSLGAKSSQFKKLLCSLLD